MPQPGNNGGEGFSWFYVYLTSEPAYNAGDGGLGKSWFVVDLTSEPVYFPGDMGQSWFVVELTTDPVYDGISPRRIGPKWRIGKPTLAYVQAFSPTGIAPTSAIGQPLVDIGTGQIVQPEPIESTAQSGNPSLASRQLVAPEGIASTSHVGTPISIRDQTVVPVGLDPTAEVGDPSLVIGTPQEISAQSVEPTAQLGEPALDSRKLLHPQGIEPTAQFGTAEITNVTQILSLPSLKPTAELGTAAVSFDQDLNTAGIAPTSQIGTPIITEGEEPPQTQPGTAGDGSPGFTAGPIVGQDFEQKWSAEFDTRLPVLNLAQVSGTTALVRVIAVSTSASVSASRNVVFKAQGTRLEASRWNKLITEDEELLLSI